MTRRRGRPDESRSAPLPLDALASLLGNTRRRFVLRYLQVRDSAATIEELADAIASREADAASAVSPELRERISSSLHHVHLPKLADAGLVCYDREAGRVAATGRAAGAEIEAFLPRDVRVPKD